MKYYGIDISNRKNKREIFFFKLLKKTDYFLTFNKNKKSFKRVMNKNWFEGSQGNNRSINIGEEKNFEPIVIKIYDLIPKAMKENLLKGIQKLLRKEISEFLFPIEEIMSMVENLNKNYLGKTKIAHLNIYQVKRN